MVEIIVVLITAFIIYTLARVYLFSGYVISLYLKKNFKKRNKKCNKIKI